MKKLLIISILALAVYSCIAQNIYTALHHNRNYPLKSGKPSVITTFSTSYGPGSDSEEKSVSMYDAAGMLVNEKRYNKEGQHTFTRDCINDTSRKLIMINVTTSYSRFGVMVDSSFSTYDENGFLIRDTDKSGSGNITTVSIIRNNEKGHPVELTLYDRLGNPYGVETATYNYEKNYYVRSNYNNQGVLLNTDTNRIDYDKPAGHYDSKELRNDRGDAVYYITTYLKKFVEREIEYKYDMRGNWIEQKLYNVRTNSAGKKKRSLVTKYKREIVYQD